MRNLFRGLGLSAALILTGLTIPASAFPDEAYWWPCGYNEVYRATYYYEYPGGPECGLTYMYCWGDVSSYHEGCQTAYYDQWYNSCQCN